MAALNISTLFKEARRRGVFRVSALYVVAAWICLQVADLAFPAFGIPESAISYVWLSAMLMFPIAIILGWRYDLVDGRIIRTRNDNDRADLSLQRKDYIMLVTLASVTAAVVTVLVGALSDSQSSISDDDWIEDVDVTSIAVLPFVNMSPDPANAYFADGLSEELLNGLTKVRDLQVTARTSSFSLRDQGLDIRQIGQQLGVANVLEGSVRVADGTIRITAQLIDSRSGIHRWSNSYDRPMNDVFAVQDEISRNIVAALKEQLEFDDRETSSTGSTPRPEAYRYFLRGRTFASSYFDNDNRGLKKAIESFKLAVDSDPEFSDAYVALAHAYIGLSKWHRNRIPVDLDERDAVLRLAREAGKTALKLAPQSSEAMRALGMISSDPVEKERAFREAVFINVNNADAYRDLASVLLERGAVEEGADMARRSHQLDPLDWQKSDLMWRVLTLEGKLKQASIFYLISIEQSGTNRTISEDQRITNLERFRAQMDVPGNLDFEDDQNLWRIQEACEGKFKFSISEDAYSGIRSGLLESLPGSDGWCPTTQRVSAKNYQEKYIRLVGMVKAKEITDHANLYITIWDEFGSINYADRWPNYIKTDTDWEEYELRIFVPAKALSISFGVVLEGEGRVLIDDLRFEAFDAAEYERIDWNDIRPRGTREYHRI